MRFSKALGQIAEIHEHITRGEVYRGFRSVPIALSGVWGLVGVGLQERVLGDETAVGRLVLYWLGVATLGALTGMSGAVYRYFFESDDVDRRRARQVMGQLLPALAAGALIAVVVLRVDLRLASWLPGLWALLFGLGVISVRPYVAPAVIWPGIYYLLAGTVLLLETEMGRAFSGWEVGAVFGVGQAATALIMYWSFERKNHAGSR